MSAVLGGYQNTTGGYYSAVGGGAYNNAMGDLSFAAGHRAKVRTGDHGTFVWADSSDADYQSSGQDQFLIRATGGVGINLPSLPTFNTPAILDVNGQVSIRGGSPAAGLVLTSVNGTGLATWSPAPGGGSDGDWNIVNSGTSVDLAVSGNLGNGQSAVHVGFSNSASDFSTTGIQSASTVPLPGKGSQMAVRGQASTDPANSYVTGSAEGRLGRVTGWSAYSNIVGAEGYANGTYLASPAVGPSFAVGGMFRANSTLGMTSGASGSFYVGGVYGEVADAINVTGTARVVAGVIGIDNNTGTSPSFGGYFSGRGYFSGDVGIGTTTPNEQLEITKNFRMPPTTATTGIIKSGTNRFIHNFGTDNTFIGLNAGNLALTGSRNTASGATALGLNTTGSQNTASGVGALGLNTGGNGNTASGDQALAANGTGNGNTAVGRLALWGNSSGEENTAIGISALQFNSTGYNNTACGRQTLLSNSTGNCNTAIGSGADVSSGALTNATAVGCGAVVNASNKIRLGNGAVTVIEGQVAYTFPSDSTQKENFRPVDGDEVLRKIRGLNIRSWNYIGNDPKQFRHYGPMAQEFFAAFGHDEVGTSGTPTTMNSGDEMGILMIAVQALEKRTAEVDKIKVANQALKERIAQLEQRTAEIDQLKSQLAELSSQVSKLLAAQATSPDKIKLAANDQVKQTGGK
jgi:hypothetical protein